MREMFPGYFAPTPEDLKRAWETGWFVLDTSVLLNLYRYEKSTRDELLTVLSKISGRLWMPYQVGLEFHRRRLSVISGEKLAFDRAAQSVSEQVSKITAIFADTSRNPHPSPALEAMLKELSGLSARISDEIKKSGSILPDVHQPDEIRTKLITIYNSQVGSSPTTDWMAALAAEGEARFKLEVPPGSKDDQKDETYTDRGTTYQAKYGDLIVWKQTLDQAKSAAWRSLIFVTDDSKTDWWHAISGKTIGPRAELREEARRASGVDTFHMYNSAGFLEQAKTYLHAQVSNKSIDQARELATEVTDDLRNLTPEEVSNTNEPGIVSAVAHWFRRAYGGGISYGEIPFDFVLRQEDGSTRNVIVRVTGIRNMSSERIFRRLQQVITERGLERCTLVFVAFSERDARAVAGEFVSNNVLLSVLGAEAFFGTLKLRNGNISFSPLDI